MRWNPLNLGIDTGRRRYNPTRSRQVGARAPTQRRGDWRIRFISVWALVWIGGRGDNSADADNGRRHGKYFTHCRLHGMYVELTRDHGVQDFGSRLPISRSFE